jgi:hypothetical protein
MDVHPLTTFVYDTFGQQFGDLLLVGYGAEPEDKRRKLYVTELEAGTEINWTIELIACRPLCCDEPLVLVALLKLLLTRPSISHLLEFELNELLTELRWQDKLSTRQQVETGIRGYVRLLYDKRGVLGAGRRKIVTEGGGYYHLLTGYVRGGKSNIGEALVRTRSRVYFDAGFIEGLRQGRIYFAGIDFGPCQ